MKWKFNLGLKNYKLAVVDLLLTGLNCRCSCVQLFWGTVCFICVVFPLIIKELQKSKCRVIATVAFKPWQVQPGKCLTIS